MIAAPLGYIVIVVICFGSLLELSQAHVAPELAPQFPEGWCNLKFGSPTRTTGECICKYSKCEGPKCRKEQGVVWYAYKECPSCQCAASDIMTGAVPLAETMEQQSAVNKGDVKRRENQATDISTVRQSERQSSHSNAQTAVEAETNDEDDKLDWIMWLDIHWREIFAGIVAILVVGIIVIAALLPKAAGESKSEDEPEEKPKSSSIAKEKKEIIKEAIKGGPNEVKDHSD